MIDVAFQRLLKERRVWVRPAVAALRPGEDLFGAPGLLDKGLLRAGAGEAAADPGLFFAGSTETVRGRLDEAKRAAGRLAAAVDAYLAAVADRREARCRRPSTTSIRS